MHYRWGIPGSVFAWIYLGLLVLPVAAAVAAMRLADSRSRRRAGESLLTRVEQLALLAGGPDRVADTLVAELLERDQLRIDSGGWLHPTRKAPADALGRLVVRLIGTTATPLHVRLRLAKDPATQALITDLVGQGLLCDMRRFRWIWGSVFTSYCALMILGIVGGALTKHDLPTGILATLPTLGVVAAGLTAGYAIRVWVTRTTSAGRAALAKARHDTALASGAAGVVALNGLTNHPDDDIRAAVRKTTPNRFVPSIYQQRYMYPAAPPVGGGPGDPAPH